jgi:CRISPR-associated endonuclease/helicase Cas3
MRCTVQGFWGFTTAFQALDAAHRPPLKWQTRLYERFVRGGNGDVPGVCRLPTGLGKTSVIPIWLIALACGAKLPRRLVYIVNRRTVVDQATDDASRILRRIEHPGDAGEHEGAACRLRDALVRLAGDTPAIPLAISTLRGELADNGEWKKNPARPAIIIGTTDMIGSKLLFSGYGDGRYGRAQHAGLIGQDALVVHDEAHLSPAFDVLLCSIAAEQERSGELRPIRVMSLSATTRDGGDDATSADSSFGIDDEDQSDPVVSQRLLAHKTLRIVDTEKGKIVAAIAGQALKIGEAPTRVLVYVRSPEAATEVSKQLVEKLGEGAGSRIKVLTGTIRGKERDELAGSDVFRAFKADSDRSSLLPHSFYLVSTSAGEVGVDLDADHLVCDLTTLDSMAQRFGRVNRLGGEDHEGKERSAQIVVVMENAAKGKAPSEEGGTDSQGDDSPGKKGKSSRAANKYEEAVLKTGEMLRGIESNGGDVSPAGLGTFLQNLSGDDKLAAFTPEPTILPATDILFDHWSLTSIAGEMPGRPPVEPYLHGVAEWEPPETHVAWRADIALLAAAGGTDDQDQDVPCSSTDLERVFEVFPLRSPEQLRDRTDRVQVQLRQIADRLRKEAQQHSSSPPVGNSESREPGGTNDDDEGGEDATNKQHMPIGPNPWIVLMRGGSAEWVRLEDIASADDAMRAQQRLSFATVVLPVSAGGLKDGMLDGTEPAPADAKNVDVAEAVTGGAKDRQRVLITGDDGSKSSIFAGTTAAAQHRFIARHAVTLAGGGDDEDAPRTIEYRVARGQDREPGERVELTAHNNAVASAAERLAKAMGLAEATVHAIKLAGGRHDAGKARDIWQRFANNLPHRGPIAKSDRYGHWKQLAGYRHELGSLHDSAAECEIQSLDADTRDLVLHLIAAHHGWARPHFEPRHFDPGDPSSGKPRSTADNERVAIETMQRFARLQRRFGRWGLAWLESLVRCADAEASDAATAEGSRP